MLSCIFILFFLPIKSFGQDSNSTTEKEYYILNFTYDSEKQSVSLNDDKDLGGAISVGKNNYSQDTGSGSQFYAQLIDINGQTKIFPDESNKI